MGPVRITYNSTNLKSTGATFREALLKGLAPDGGLYMPSFIPVLDKDLIKTFISKKYSEIAFDILSVFLGDELPGSDLRKICYDAYNYDVPLEKVTPGSYIMRLDQGPTASFKDFAARIMARLMHYYVKKEGKRYTVLTATSGDTGSAVASAYAGLEGINVVILFPVGEVSSIQRKQMSTLGANVRVIAVDGKFDDCQRLVKQAFNDSELAPLNLTSANSINIGRLIPQSIYYFYAWSKLTGGIDEKAVFSVPSGNFGNLMGGLIAKKMGLPADYFVVATNLNNEVPEYLKSGLYSPLSPSINCISSAMNVGHPSNLARIVALFGGRMDENGTVLRQPDLEEMRKQLRGISISDEETRETIRLFHKKYSMIIEPHGAVAWRGIETLVPGYRKKLKNGSVIICLETAHPAKFAEEIYGVLGIHPALPDSIKNISGRKEEYEVSGPGYNEIKSILTTIKG
jgi:threonine synthase